MGKAIAVLSVIVVCCFAFVAFQLSTRRPRGRAAAAAASPLRPRDDGSLYSVDVEIKKLERRLVEEEKRSLKLQQELAAITEEREKLTTQVTELEDDVRRLRRTVNGRITPPNAPANTPANAPANPPGAPGNSPDGPGTGNNPSSVTP